MSRPLTGQLLVAFAIIHLATGLVLFTDPLGDIAGSGVVIDAVEPDSSQPLYDRAAAFWYTICGLVSLILGSLTWWTETRIGLPASFGWMLAALAALGVLLMPVSGFWIFFIPAAAALRSARRTRPGRDRQPA